MAETFDGDWLVLREPFDAASRSMALAHRLGSVLPGKARLIDLGAGTGSLFRWLAPILDRPQEWTLADADAALLERAFAEISRWATARGLPVTATASAMVVRTPKGAWRVEAEVVDLAAPLSGLGLNRRDAVVCSALLDLVSAEWMGELAAVLKRPLLACLSVDGRDRLYPAHPVDRMVFAGFRRDQQRAKGLGVALGPRAPGALRATFAARGWTVQEAASDWHLPAAAADMLDLLVASHGEVAARRIGDRREMIRAWARMRAHQVNKGRLAMRVGHRDSLALPPGVANEGE